MAKREIIDSLKELSGERIARYVWRSKPTRSPLSDRQVRCIVAEDEKGRYWAGLRIGRGHGQKAEYELWETCKTKQEAMSISRQQGRMLLSTHAELYSNTVTGKGPGEKNVEVTMDDGWKVAINAPGAPRAESPESKRLMGLLNRIGSGKTPPQKPRSRGPSIDR